MEGLIRREETAFPERPARPVRPSVYARPSEDDSLDIRRYFNVLLKRRWLIVAVVATVLFLVALQSFTTTPMYKSSTDVEIDPGSANILPCKDP